MKKIFLLFAVILSVTMVHSQTQVKYGVKGGLNLTNVAGQDADGNKYKLGFHVGGFAAIDAAEHISLQPELLFSLQGARYKGEGGKGSVNTYYINLPVMVKYTFDEGYFAETGPQLGYMVSAKARQDGETTNMNDGYRKIDFAWGFGVGYMVKSNVGVNLRFNLGLSKLDKEGEAKVYNRALQVGVIYNLSN